jgi:dTDP-4-dehydrorhamnose 3,5-epimerase
MTTFSSTPLAISDVLLVQPRKFSDHRGYFLETFGRKEFEQLGIESDFVQDNQSFSARRGTVRGLHFQLPPHPQAKLVRVLKGAVFDVAIDLRRGSPTFGHWCGTTLTAEKANQLFVPRGFAHAFCTLDPDTEVAYKVDDYYAPECDAGLIWNDPDLGIDWPIAAQDAVLSEKDARLPRWADFESPFVYTERK